MPQVQLAVTTDIMRNIRYDLYNLVMLSCCFTTACWLLGWTEYRQGRHFAFYVAINIIICGVMRCADIESITLRASVFAKAV